MVEIRYFVVRMRFVVLPSFVANDAQCRLPSPITQSPATIWNVLSIWCNGASELLTRKPHSSAILLSSVYIPPWRSELQTWKWMKKVSAKFGVANVRLLFNGLIRWLHCLFASLKIFWMNFQSSDAGSKTMTKLFDVARTCKLKDNDSATQKQQNTLYQWKYASEWIIYNGIHNKWMRNGWIRTEKDNENCDARSNMHEKHNDATSHSIHKICWIQVQFQWHSPTPIMTIASLFSNRFSFYAHFNLFEREMPLYFNAHPHQHTRSRSRRRIENETRKYENIKKDKTWTETKDVWLLQRSRVDSCKSLFYVVELEINWRVIYKIVRRIDRTFRRHWTRAIHFSQCYVFHSKRINLLDVCHWATDAATASSL